MSLSMLADYSGDSEEECSDENESTIEEKCTLTKSNDSVVTTFTLSESSKFKHLLSNSSDEEDGSELEAVAPKLANTLPKPKAPVDNENPEDEVLPPKKVYSETNERFDLDPLKKSIEKTSQGPVKITIPSLKDFEEDEKEEKKLIIPSKKGSNLLSILPEPKHSGCSNLLASVSSQPGPSSSQRGFLRSSSLVPQSVSRPKVGEKLNPKLQKLKNKYIEGERNFKIVSSKKDEVEDMEDEEESAAETVDFFHTNDTDFEKLDPKKLEELKLPTPDFDAIEEKKLETNDATDSGEVEDNTQERTLMPPEKKRKKGPDEPIDFIEISADDLRPQSTEWLKNITEEQVTPRRFKGPGGAMKRKHQITYLAFEAKAREQELKNQWAQNKVTRMQTRSKYGF